MKRERKALAADFIQIVRAFSGHHYRQGTENSYNGETSAYKVRPARTVIGAQASARRSLVRRESEERRERERRVGQVKHVSSNGY